MRLYIVICMTTLCSVCAGQVRDTISSSATGSSSYQMDEVAVTASIIKVIQKGDTLVYNAEAFKLPEGSMLNVLIGQLPGVELKESGEIVVNGRRVDELLLNGNHLIKNDRHVMLDNLPHYVVKHVRVYDTVELGDYQQERMFGRKKLVMDVMMKRKYLDGLISNAEAGYGNHDRFLGRLFALAYGRQTRLTFFLNSNNLNSFGLPNKSDEWKPSDKVNGQSTIGRYGMNLLWDSRDKKVRNVTDADLMYRKTCEQSNYLTHNYFDSGDIYETLVCDSRDHGVGMSLKNELTISDFLMKKSSFSSCVQVCNDKKDVGRTLRKASLLINPSIFGSKIPQILDSLFNAKENLCSMPSLVNRYSEDYMDRKRIFTAKGDLQWAFSLSGGNKIVANICAFYKNDRPSRQSLMRHGYYTQTGESQMLMNERFFSELQNEYTTSVMYMKELKKNWSFMLGFKHCYGKRQRKDFLHFNRSPDEDVPKWVVDMSNSKTYSISEWKYIPNVEIARMREGQTFFDVFAIHSDLPFYHERMNMRSVVLTDVRKRRHFLPTLQLMYSGSLFSDCLSSSYKLNYSLTHEHPDFTLLFNIPETIDPLAVRLPNGKLSSAHLHQLDGEYSRRFFSRHDLSYSLGFNMEITDGKTGMRTFYDVNSGSYHFMPDNVGGNWSSGFIGGFSMKLDKGGHFYLSNSLSAGFVHARDFLITDSVHIISGSHLTTVNSVRMKDNIMLKYSRGSLNIDFKAGVDWWHNKGNSKQINRIDIFDFKYEVSANILLPFGVNFYSSVSVYSRRGCQRNDMNTDDIILNASLSKSFLRNNSLTIKLTAFDLLHQLKDRQVSITPQGYVETWRSCLKNYVMLSLYFRFEKTGKSKE